ncbi:hypothetical protein ADT71_00975 [Novosphingobium sp. ST904]|nr:hypothetical protein ADT71_00975 [Novosphingobium sp. ST904]
MSEISQFGSITIRTQIVGQPNWTATVACQSVSPIAAIVRRHFADQPSRCERTQVIIQAICRTPQLFR